MARKSRKKKDDEDAALSEEDIRAAEEHAKKMVDEVVVPQRIEESIEAKREFDELISTEEELLDFFSEDRFQIQLEYRGRVFDFKARPLTSVKDLDLFNFDLTIYSELEGDDQKVMQRVIQGEELSPEQKKRYDELMQKYGEEFAVNTLETMDKILANFVTPPDFDGDIKKREEFWSKVDFVFKTVLLGEVQKRIGLTDDAEVRLFQAR